MFKFLTQLADRIADLLLHGIILQTVCSLAALLWRSPWFPRKLLFCSGSTSPHREHCLQDGALQENSLRGGLSSLPFQKDHVKDPSYWTN